MFSESLVGAIHDYRWLLDRGYPEAGSISLVGDRFRLDRDERHVLFRGVSAEVAARRRGARIVPPEVVGAAADGENSDAAPRPVLGIDGHNVLLTVANYLRGVRTFECDDGLIRDIGGVHGRVRDGTLMARAIHLAAETLSFLQGGPVTVEVCFDAPVSYSRKHAAMFQKVLEQRGVVCRVQVVSSPDTVLGAADPLFLATSDSLIIDATASGVYDLARHVIVSHFAPEFDSIRAVVADRCGG